MELNAPNLLLLATLLPLASFLVLIFLGRKLRLVAAAVGTMAILGSFALSVTALIMWFSKLQFHRSHAVEAVVYPWITIKGFGTLEVGLLVDSLTLVMFVMVTLVATLVHIFSIGYMAGDSRFSRFFAYLGLFCFSMLALVLSDSLLQLFVFWELVGICSYLLIGFWFEERGPALASKKAVVTNRIGDVGFIVGLGILIWQLGPGALTLVSASGVSPLVNRAREVAGFAAPELLIAQAGPAFLGLSWLTWAGMGLCLGAMAKSAQFPLHVWLPDAMEGPTPVSALIHAATMVAAGVYLIARIFPVLTLDARLFIAIIGCTTLALGALIAMVMTDIKKVLAYSTISQLGFMMLFLGCGGYVAGLFHLMTHAFFKAGLFLAAGSVIAGCQHEQEVAPMGGLWRKMPITALTFGVSVLAIAGTPWFSGWYSKELGMAVVYDYAYALPQPVGIFSFAPRLLFWIPAVSAYFTAFYMWRLWWLVFGGKPRDVELWEQAKESPVMTLPLTILGLLAVVAGMEPIQIRQLLTLAEPLNAYAHSPSELAAAMSSQYIAWAFVVGPVLAVLIYLNGFGVATRLRRLPVMNLLYHWLKNKMYFDAVYEGIIVYFCKLLAKAAGWFDRRVIDGIVNLSGYVTLIVSWISGKTDEWIVDRAVNGLAETAQGSGRLLMRWQTGRIRFYMLTAATVVAIVAAGAAIFFMRRA